MLTKTVNKRASDPIDRLIFEKGLRITQIIAVKKQDYLIVFLNNRNTINVRLSFFPRLKKATQLQLDKWQLISKGIGIEWSELNEDLSLKGFIQQLIVQNTLRYVTGDSNFATAA